MIVTNYPHSKSTHNLIIKEIKIIKNSKYVSKSQNVENLLPHVNGCNVHDIKKKVATYNTRK
jgi:hypothetical protein